MAHPHRAYARGSLDLLTGDVYARQPHLLVVYFRAWEALVWTPRLYTSALSALIAKQGSDRNGLDLSAPISRCAALVCAGSPGTRSGNGAIRLGRGDRPTQLGMVAHGPARRNLCDHLRRSLHLLRLYRLPPLRQSAGENRGHQAGRRLVRFHPPRRAHPRRLGIRRRG